MYKSLVAGVTALSLVFSTATPVQAAGLSDKDVGKILFGLVAAATLSAAINNSKSGHRAEVTTRRPEPTDRRHGYGNNNGRSARMLPRECLQSVETRYGDYRLFNTRCLQENYRHAASLPRNCEVRVYSNGRPRNGYDPQCLRDNGFRAQR